MAKLLEKNGAEMCAALVSVAGSVRSFLDDQEFKNTFVECTKKGAENRMEQILTIYADLVPLLFGSHLNDTLGILAVVEGKPVKELMKMNGVELLKDAVAAWNEQISPFFSRLGLTT